MKNSSLFVTYIQIVIYFSDKSEVNNFKENETIITIEEKKKKKSKKKKK
jgi:hypothetical protein